MTGLIAPGVCQDRAEVEVPEHAPRTIRADFGSILKGGLFVHHLRPYLAPLVVAAALLSFPATGAAQGTFMVGLMGTLGGAADADPDTGLTNVGWQALFTMETQIATRFDVRVGQLPLDGGDSGLFDSDLTYVTLAGEYTFPAEFYESGLYLGLGYYDLAGDVLVADDSSLGLNIGATGDFHLTDRFSLLVEFSGHYADLGHAQFFFMGQVGVGFHF